MKVIELFAGVGSQTQALKNIGIKHEVIGIAEIDKYAISGYNQLHGETHNFGDISKIEELPKADLWTYSFPCQDISVAGKGQGIKQGTRSGLLFEVERLLEVSEKPKYLLMENVKNLVGKKHIEDFKKWQIKLNEMGYTNYWQVLNAKDYGIPQNRERVFMISILGEHKRYEFPEKETLKRKLKDMLETEVEERFYLSRDKVDLLLSNGNINPSGKGMNGKVNIGDIQGTLTTNKGEGPKILEKNEIIQVGNLKETESFGGNPQTGRVYSIKGISPCLNTMQGGDRQPKILDFKQSIRENGPRVYKEGICPTITSRDYKGPLCTVDEKRCLEIKTNTKKGYIEAEPGDYISVENLKSKTRRGRVQKNCGTILTAPTSGTLTKELRIRKLTPKECWRLMGWKDEQFDKIKGISNSQLYKQAGNGIVVDVLERIFEKMFK